MPLVNPQCHGGEWLLAELVLQYPDQETPGSYRLVRSQHRIAADSTVRQLLLLAPDGIALIQAVEARTRGLSRHGRRAWLDDLLSADDRVEVLCPILLDAKAARLERVSKSRAARRRVRG